MVLDVLSAFLTDILGHSSKVARQAQLLGYLSFLPGPSISTCSSHRHAKSWAHRVPGITLTEQVQIAADKENQIDFDMSSVNLLSS